MTSSTENPPNNNPDATHQPSKIFVINPDIDNRTLLEHAHHSLASAHVIAGNFRKHPNVSQTKALVGIQQLIMTAELAVKRVLDNLDPP